MAESGVTAEEMERARALLERDHLQGLSSPSMLADALGSCEQLFDDPALAIPWPLPPVLLSPRDRAAPMLAELTGSPC